MIDQLGQTAVRALHLLDAETAHRLTIRMLRAGLVPARPFAPDPVLASTRWGLRLANPIGLAAGFDKNAEVADAMLRLGFGFVETGSVTPLPQAGNPRPRLFRLSQDQAVINRMGFNNDGLEAVHAHLAGRTRGRGIVGTNLGANKDSTDRIGDYVAGVIALAGLVDYFVVNISSPNTPGLRDLQAREPLSELISRVRAARDDSTPDEAPRPPVLVKIAPDFDEAELGILAETLAELAVDGIVVSNTTVELREGLRSRHANEAGGLSGRPLFALSTERLRQVYAVTEGRIPLVGVGGVESGETAYAKIRAGASLVQLYTALVYHGPGLVRRIAADLAALLRRDGFAHLDEAVGADLHK